MIASAAGSTLCPIVATVPLTVTRPALIRSSAFRRDATPARASARWIRIDSATTDILDVGVSRNIGPDDHENLARERVAAGRHEAGPASGHVEIDGPAVAIDLHAGDQLRRIVLHI